MRDFRDAKAMASTLRDELAARSVQLSRADCLEVIAKAFGAADWNTLSAQIKAQAGERTDKDTGQQVWPTIMRPFYARHLTPDEQSGPWMPLFMEARALHAAGAPPDSDEVMDLARRWVALSLAINGSEDGLRERYAAAYKEALADPQIGPKLPLSREVLEYLAPVLARAKSERDRPSTQQD